jgi:hypothetical protein
MSGIVTKVRNGLVAASLVGALGFGATQALATPAEAAKAAVCSPGQCDKQCKQQFGPFAAGYCDPFGGCSCAV